ncbi:hypothetical protein SAMN02745244_00039 [Tessaracoccus bendigoensis DSM 12906]|uniref:MinD-like ATPase involved in chromosome partitioning or flagellar assembly n=1 Tax=Tessaracoccus bendigoensis DSM 12906 TaxID=1123357 RepID=A0A1M6A0U0_9ACTN|nr:hypothetical protein [Tessaracoccus bendigoensis]SHI30058.1 hypothetical protein SAMN02745244_00039 [Tessaracoccus bendigoensis DSM 12906]
MTAHSVAELREAWRAIEGGEFAHGPRSAPNARSAATAWTPAPGERVVAVVGCAGGVGASTVALALATAAAVPARVVECCPPLASGFSAAANAELGTFGPWRRGSRGDVLLERPIAGDAILPVPTESSVEWTLVDTNWTTVSGPGEWLASVLRTLDDVVLVSNATVPGVRRLESCAELLGRDALGVVVGPTIKRWPRPVKVAAAGIPARVHLADFPLDSRLQVTGLTPDPLPAPLLKAAENVLALLRKEPT